MIKKIFSQDNIKSVFYNKVSKSSGSGIDGISLSKFDLIGETNIIHRKILNNTYKFTKYKLKLINKGKGLPPREISIPTIRDRIVLRIISEYLTSKFKDFISLKTPQKIIKEVKAHLNNNFDHFIKIDIKNFFPSINHEQLMKRIRRLVRNRQILELIQSSTITQSIYPSHDGLNNNLGVPQGLSISNILAAIYLINFDLSFNKLPCRISYHRYVDDILILCDESDQKTVLSHIQKKFREIELEFHDPSVGNGKSQCGKISEEFSYLGYRFYLPQISVRHNSIQNLINSLIKIFSEYHKSNQKNKILLLWKLNLRITGCIFQNKQRGWLFFFSEITDKGVLHKLDFLVLKLARRYNVNIKPKKFMKTFHEIIFNLKQTKYIPNFDLFQYGEKKFVLTEYFGYNNDDLISPNDVERIFSKEINTQVNELLIDVRNIS